MRVEGVWIGREVRVEEVEGGGEGRTGEINCETVTD